MASAVEEWLTVGRWDERYWHGKGASTRRRCLPQIPHGLVWDLTRSCPVRDRRLLTWVFERFFFVVSNVGSALCVWWPYIYSKSRDGGGCGTVADEGRWWRQQGINKLVPRYVTYFSCGGKSVDILWKNSKIKFALLFSKTKTTHFIVLKTHFCDQISSVHRKHSI